MFSTRVIYVTEPVNFIKRIWLNFRRNWFLFFYLFTVPFGIKEFNWLGKVIIILITALYVAVMLYDAFEKAYTQIVGIEITDNDVLITALERNKLNGFSVPIGGIRVHLERVRMTRSIISNLKLTLSNYDNHFLTQYSNGTKKSRVEIEEIIYQIEAIVY